MRFAGSLIAALSAFVATLVGAAPPAIAQEAVDVLAWRAARSDGTTEAYQEFLQKFPTSAYASEAFRAMVAAQIAARAGLDPTTIGDGRMVEGTPLTLFARLY